MALLLVIDDDPKDLTLIEKILQQGHYTATLAQGGPQGWDILSHKTPQAVGIMYTTWQDKYELLGPFGDLVAERSK